MSADPFLATLLFSLFLLLATAAIASLLLGSVARRLGARRIRDHLEAMNCRPLTMIANPSPFRLLGERYAITYRNAEGTLYRADCVASLFLGVHLSNETPIEDGGEGEGTGKPDGGSPPGTPSGA